MKYTIKALLFCLLATMAISCNDDDTHVEKVVEAKEYKKHIAVFKLTGTWCSFCPEGSRRLDYVLEDDGRNRYDNAHILAFHGGMTGEPMRIPQTNLLYYDFGLTGYPSVIYDMRKGYTDIKIDEVRKELNESINDYPSYFGVSIASDLNSAKDEVNIQVSIETSVKDSYRIIVYLTEDNIIAAQKDGEIINYEYKHNHVVRKLVSESYTGDATGEIAAGYTVVKGYNCKLDAEWVTDELKAYALIIAESTGFIQNMALCKVDGGSMNSED